MTTPNNQPAPEGFLRLSSRWLIDNPLPEDARYYNVLFRSWESTKWAGYLLDHVLNQGYTYATARTDLPREAYADEIRPMTHEERKALDEFTTKELTESEPTPDLTQPGLPKADLTQPEVASERAEEYIEPKTVREAQIHCQLKVEVNTLRAQLEAKEGECRRLRENLDSDERSLGHWDAWLSSVLDDESDEAPWNIAAALFTRLTAELDAVRKEIPVSRIDGKPLAESVKSLALALRDASQEIDASQARCGELERALTKAERFVWDFAHKNPTHFMKGVEQDPWGAHELFTQINALLTPSQQPENLKGPACGPTGETASQDAPSMAHGSGVASDSIPEAGTNFDSSSTEGRAGCVIRLEHDGTIDGSSPAAPIGASDSTARDTAPTSENQASPAVPTSRPEPVKAGEVGLDYSGKCRVYYHDYENGVWASRWEPHDWVISYTGRTRMCRNCRNGEVIPAPPIAPEGKATEGEG